MSWKTLSPSIKVTFFLLFGIFLPGCDHNSENSSDYNSGEIYVDFDVYIPSFDANFRNDPAPNTSATVNAYFYTDYEDTNIPLVDALISGTLDPDDTVDLKLTGGDRILVNDGTTEKEMQEVGGLPNYTTSFSTIYTPGTDFSFSFRRGNGEILTSSVTIPEFVTLVTPTSGQSFSVNNEDINITWTGNNSLTYTLEIDGPCVVRYREEINPGNTSLTISAGTLQRGLLNDSSTCDVVARLLTTLTGTVDENLRDGSSFDVYLASGVVITITGL